MEEVKEQKVLDREQQRL